MGDLIPIRRAGQRAPCSRCGAPCRVAATTRVDASMLKHATVPDGHCVNCEVAAWFVQVGLRETTDPLALRAPSVHEVFRRVMKVSNADASPVEIDWEHVIEHWALPFEVRGKGGKVRRRKFDVYVDAALRERLAREGGTPMGDA